MRLAAYIEATCRLDPGELEAAIRNATRACRFLPSPAEILERAPRRDTPWVRYRRDAGMQQIATRAREIRDEGRLVPPSLLGHWLSYLAAAQSLGVCYPVDGEQAEQTWRPELRRWAEAGGEIGWFEPHFAAHRYDHRRVDGSLPSRCSCFR